MTTAKKQLLLHTTFNYLTGETTTRELTAEEITDRESQAVEIKAQEATATARINARVSALAKLAKLGLTQAEIEAL